MDNETKRTCSECSYFHMVVCGYFDQYANADDYACGHFYDEPPDDYEYERFVSLLGKGFDPSYFDIRSARRRIYDYERTIGEVLNSFYVR